MLRMMFASASVLLYILQYLPGAGGVMGRGCIVLNEITAASVSDRAAFSTRCVALHVIILCQTTTALAKQPAAWSDVRRTDAGRLLLFVFLPCFRWCLRSHFQCVGGKAILKAGRCAGADVLFLSEPVTIGLYPAWGSILQWV